MNQTHFKEDYSAEFNDSLKSLLEFIRGSSRRSLIISVISVAYLIYGWRNGFQWMEDPLHVLLSLLLFVWVLIFFAIFVWPYRYLHRLREPLPLIELNGNTISLTRGGATLITSELSDIRYDDRSEMLDKLDLFRSTIPEPIPLIVVLQKARWWKFQPWAFAVGFTEKSKTRWEEIFENAGVSKVEGNDDAG